METGFRKCLYFNSHLLSFQFINKHFQAKKICRTKKEQKNDQNGMLTGWYSPWDNTVIFKVAFSTFQFKFGATLRRQAERSDSEARHKANNLT